MKLVVQALDKLLGRCHRKENNVWTSGWMPDMEELERLAEMGA